MVLSRFWSVMIAGSILYILGLLAAGRLDSIAHVVNEKQNDPLVVAEVPVKEFSLREPVRFAALETNKAAGLEIGDTLYQLTDGGMVQVSVRSEERRVGKECRSRWS